MGKLYELTTELAFINKFLEESVDSDEIDALLAKTNSLQIEINKKALGIGIIAKEMEWEIEKFKKAETEIKRRREAMQNKLERISDYLLKNMEENSVNCISNEYLQIKIKKNPPSLKIINELQIPEKYYEIVTSQQLKKSALKEDLKNGEKIDGAMLVQKNRVEIK